MKSGCTSGGRVPADPGGRRADRSRAAVRKTCTREGRTGCSAGAVQLVGPRGRSVSRPRPYLRFSLCGWAPSEIPQKMRRVRSPFAYNGRWRIESNVSRGTSCPCLRKTEQWTCPIFFALFQDFAKSEIPNTTRQEYDGTEFPNLLEVDCARQISLQGIYVFLELTGTDAFHLTRWQQKSSNKKWFHSNGLFVSMSCSQKLKEQLVLG